MPYMTRIPSDMARWGLPVKFVDGAGTRGRSSFAPRAVVDHWTATPFTTRSVIPTLGVLINGHGSLPGPLCNVGLAFNGDCYYVAAGKANHAGSGGWNGAVGNSAAYGIEAEGVGKWTAEQRYVYPLLIAALLDGLDRDADDDCGHSEWAGPRKSDINGWPDGGMNGLRRRVQMLLDAGRNASPLNHYPTIQAAIAAQGPDPFPVQEDDMTPEQAGQLQAIFDTLNLNKGDVGRRISETHARAGAAEVQTRSIGGQVWAQGLHGLNGFDKDGKPTFGPVAAGVRLANADAKTDSRQVAAVVAGAVAQVLAALPDDVEVDPAKIEAAATQGALAGVKQALRESVPVEVSVKGAEADNAEEVR